MVKCFYKSTVTHIARHKVTRMLIRGNASKKAEQTRKKASLTTENEPKVLIVTFQLSRTCIIELY